LAEQLLWMKRIKCPKCSFFLLFLSFYFPPHLPALRSSSDAHTRVLVLTPRANSPRAHASDREPREARFFSSIPHLRSLSAQFTGLLSWGCCPWIRLVVGAVKQLLDLVRERYQTAPFISKSPCFSPLTCHLPAPSSPSHGGPHPN
jgi:hypothetical protein